MRNAAGSVCGLPNVFSFQCFVTCSNSLRPQLTTFRSDLGASPVLQNCTCLSDNVRPGKCKLHPVQITVTPCSHWCNLCSCPTHQVYGMGMYGSRSKLECSVISVPRVDNQKDLNALNPRPFWCPSLVCLWGSLRQSCLACATHHGIIVIVLHDNDDTGQVCHPGFDQRHPTISDNKNSTVWRIVGDLGDCRMIVVADTPRWGNPKPAVCNNCALRSLASDLSKKDHIYYRYFWCLLLPDLFACLWHKTANRNGSFLLQYKSFSNASSNLQ